MRGEQFQISTVARLTGLSAHTIRAWEKRYNVVSPARTDTHRRLYSRDDIRKLTLLKHLVDEGNPISLIAGLSADQLAGHTETPGTAAAPRLNGQVWGQGKCRVLVVGEAVRAMFEEEGTELEELEAVGSFASLPEVSESFEGVHLDLLVVETPTLFAETIQSVSSLLARSGARRAILIYGFAQRETLRQLLGSPRLTAIRGPIRASELKLAAAPEIYVRSGNSAPQPGPTEADSEQGELIPPQRFSREQLAKISRVSTTVQCECPQHLGKLLSDLTAFEQYSLECENRSPEDTKIHAFLHLSTARARALLEEALVRVLESEGIRI